MLKDTWTGMDTWISKELPVQFSDDMGLRGLSCLTSYFSPVVENNRRHCSEQKKRRHHEFLFELLGNWTKFGLDTSYVISNYKTPSNLQKYVCLLSWTEFKLKLD